MLGRRVGVLRVLNRFHEQSFKHVQVNVCKSFDIKAGLSCLILPQFLHKRVVIFKSRHDVERNILFAGGESGEKPVSFMSAGILVMIRAISDHAISPHFCRFTGYVLHEVVKREAVFSFLLIFYLPEKAFHIYRMGLGL